MKSEFSPMPGMLVLFTLLLAALAGCGSGSSTGATTPTGGPGSTTNIGTGSIALKLVWNVNGSVLQKRAAEKVLYAAPAGVVKMRFTVSAADMTDIIKEFAATPGVDGSGQIDGIPAGSGRKVTAQGLDSVGTVIFQGATLNNIEITTGAVTLVGTIPMKEAVPPITTASIVGGAVNAGQIVTLSANESATIFYTTNGSDPSILGSPSGPHTGVDVTISTPITLKFFAVDDAGNQEAVKSEIYTVN